MEGRFYFSQYFQQLSTNAFSHDKFLVQKGQGLIFALPLTGVALAKAVIFKGLEV
jgi:hypothetical protein